MAIYHFSGTVISRSQGKSSVVSAAYRAGEKLYDERQERAVDYSRKQDVAYKEILLPDGAPEWMADREKLWNAVEKAENRKDAQLAREVHFSLPREFSKEQNIELAREFVKEEMVSCGMVADLCIHDGKTKDGEEQPHAHVMLTMRKVTEDGFGLKERGWNAKENYMLWREAWAEHVNKYLALNGIEQRIDHRSYAERGIDLTPQGKIGPKNLEDHERRVEEHRSIARENGDKILEDPSIALKAITYHQSTFTHQDLARFINRHTIDADQFRLVYEKVKASELIVALTDEQGKERFTTREMQVLESKMVDRAIELKDSAHITCENVEFSCGIGLSVNRAADYDIERSINCSIDHSIDCSNDQEPYRIDESNDNASVNVILSLQQQDALNHIIGDGDIKCLVGYAGTGKSRLLGEAREIWEKEGYRVHGATLSGIAAENLEGASGIESRTLASRCYYWDRGEERLTKKDVLIIDEAGMLGSRQVARVLEEVREGGAKTVFIGDPQQLQAIEAGAAFRAISEQTGYLELTEIRRQQESWQQEATKEFALRHTQKALDLYEQHDCVHVFATQEEAKMALIEKWDDARTDYPEKSQIMLSYTRRDAQELNEMARNCRKENNEIGEDQELQTENGNKDFAIGDRIYFLRNDRALGVKNGTLGTIENIDKEIGLGIGMGVGQVQITVKLDRDDPNGNSQTVAFSLDKYNYITHGYAATIHKAQGVTVDQSHILASKHLDSHSAYVGMTRHKERADLYWSKEEFTDKKELEQVLSRDRSKDVTLDYIDREVVEISRGGVDIEIGREVNKKKEVQGFDQENLLHKKVESGEKEQSEFAERTQKGTNAELLREPKEEVDRCYEIFLRDILGQEKAEAFLLEKHGHKVDYSIIDQEGREKAGIETSYVGANSSPALSEQEQKAEDLINEYYRLDDKYEDVKKQKGLPFAKALAKKQVERCVQELCKNKRAMHYLKENDVVLFNEAKLLEEQGDKIKEMQTLSFDAKVDKIREKCAVNVLSIKSYNWKQAYFIQEGTFSAHIENCLEEYRGEIKRCVREYGDGDKEILVALKQRDSKLFNDINHICDNVLNKSLKEIDSNEELRGLTKNRTALYEKTLFMEKEYRRLEQEYADANKGVAEMFKGGYTIEELKEPKEVRDSIGTDLDICAQEIYKDIEVTKTISRHDRELFRGMNERFDNMFTEAIRKDDLIKERGRESIDKTVSEKQAEKLIERYRGYEDRYDDLEKRGGSRFSMSEAKDRMEGCAHEICHDKNAMDYLQKNDRELFKEISGFQEREKVLERQKGFELEL